MLEEFITFWGKSQISHSEHTAITGGVLGGLAAFSCECCETRSRCSFTNTPLTLFPAGLGDRITNLTDNKPASLTTGPQLPWFICILGVIVKESVQ